MKARFAAALSLCLVLTPFFNQDRNCLASIDSGHSAGPPAPLEGRPAACERGAHGPLVYKGLATRLDAPPAEKPKPKPKTARSESLVRTALRFRGTPYRYAGTSSRGMDCSGLVSRVLNAHGIRAPHSSAALFKMGRPVAFKDLRPGDLLFFATRGRRVSHVGLYMGNGKFVHASSRSGGVITSSLSEPYYAKRYVGARRLF